MDVNQAIDQANQANNTMMWLFIAIFVITPIAFIIITIPVVILSQRQYKCPKCGFWRKNRSAVQTVKTVEGDKATITTQSVVICRKCKNEFTI